MLNVLTPDEVYELIEHEFFEINDEGVSVGLDGALGRILAKDAASTEYVPDFNRSTVDGYALRATDTFGCSDSIPAVLPLHGQVHMGIGADFVLPEGSCCYVPTGGEIPSGADCMVMLEYVEDYGDGTVGIMKPGAPGANIIFRGDDVYPGKVILEKGRRITPPDIGALAAAGVGSIRVKRRIRVGVISTGDELVSPLEKPGPGQVRDVNSPMLKALYEGFGAEVVEFGIIRDEKPQLRNALEKALKLCDIVILSGGSSVGVKDAACDVIKEFGEMLFHGIAIKPGKPAMMGRCGGKPVVGLPGHPVAAYFVAELFTLPLIRILSGEKEQPRPALTARLSESIGANHGRAQVNAVRLTGGLAFPVRSKSGLISSLAGTDGYILIARDCEGLGKNAEIEVYL